MNSLKGPARAVLQILGFQGFYSFAEAAGVHYMTAASILYQYVQRQVHISAFARVYETLRSAYEEKKDILSTGERRFVEAWLKKWSASAVKHFSAPVLRPREIANPNRHQRARRARLKKKRKTKLLAITKWTPVSKKDIPRVD